MKVGEIKAEALKLMGVNGGMNVTYLDVNGLMNDEASAAYLVGMDPAINRALDRMVLSGLLEKNAVRYVDVNTRPYDELENVPDSLARMIPYYIKGEVYAEDPDSAAYAMRMFESMLGAAAANLNPKGIEEVYKCV